MDINLVQTGAPSIGSAVPEAVLPSAGKGATFQTPQIRQPAQQQAPKQEQAQFNQQASEAVREQNLQQAAQMMVSDIYAVADMKFSIYKDLSGQFVTRFTSLRDGAVTYFPEQDMSVYMESRGARRKALLKLDV
ncbi:MAG: hypothetical protein FJX23_01665 [Alphaproteobacteria bacterium]|nr:hypothetical protein [Alphaproteobacteria bacterium]